MTNASLRSVAEEKVKLLEQLATGETQNTWSADDYIRDARRAVQAVLENGEVVDELSAKIDSLVPSAKKQTAMQAMRNLRSCCERDCTLTALGDALYFAEAYTREAKELGADVADLENEFALLKEMAKTKKDR